jgi:hypothetical protein
VLPFRAGEAVSNALWEAARAAVRQVAEDLTVRRSMIFPEGRSSQASCRGLRTAQRGPLMLACQTDVRGERVVVIQVNWIGQPSSHISSSSAPLGS